MKRTIALILAMLLCFGMCACGGSGSDSTGGGKPGKMTTERAAENTAKHAINTWMQAKVLGQVCTDFEYEITDISKSSMKLADDAETGMQWYTATGTVIFYDDRGDVLTDGIFTYTFGHDGVSSVSVVDDDTQVILSSAP